MSFKLGDIIIKEVLYGYAEDLSADALPLYLLTQLSELTIEITAEAVEVTDKNGNLIKKYYKSKAGTLSATNALVNTNIIAAASGVDPVFATSDNAVVMPKIIAVSKGETVTLTDYVEGSIKINQLYNNGSLGAAFSLDTTASDTAFSITTEGVLTLPTAADVDQYLIRYDRKVTDGVKISNTVDDFPASIRLLFKATYFDPCEKNTVKGCYIEIPSFQVSPEVSIPIQDEATMDYKGDLETDYCSSDKVLYNIYFADDDEE